MVKKLNWLLVLILLLSLPALACDAFGGSDEVPPTAVPAVGEAAEVEADVPAPEVDTETTTKEETAAAEPTAASETVADNDTTADNDTAVTADEAPDLSASALELPVGRDLPFTDYRMVMVLAFSGVDNNGESVSQSVDAEFAFASDPQASSISMSFAGMQEDIGFDSIEMAQIGETTYMVLPEMGCITTQGNDMFQDNPFTEMLAPNSLLQDLENAKYEGEETINGIRTLHYSFDETTLNGNGDDKIEEANGDVYIAKDDNFLVRMVMDASGQMELFDDSTNQGDMHVEIDLLDVGQSINITMPAACEAGADGGGSSSDFPKVDDATDMASFPGMMSYLTSMATEDVLAFYDDALSADGWVKNEDESMLMGSLATIIYNRDGQKLNLTITPDEANDSTYVILMSEPKE